MKQLILVRHANSPIQFIKFKDFDRPLSSLGESDAKLMAEQLLTKKIIIDNIISSGANRAFTTSEIIAENINFNASSIKINNNIYFSSEDQIIDIIKNISDKFNMTMMVGHNPTFHHLSQKLSNEKNTIFPPCSMCCIEFNVNSWIDVYKGKKQFMIYPDLFKD